MGPTARTLLQQTLACLLVQIRACPARFPHTCLARPLQRLRDLTLCAVPAQPARPPTFVCVELKYCCDYRPQHQRARAETQHRALLAALRGAGYDAHTVVLLLGVSGTIYTHTQDLMHTHLGVPKGRVRDMSKQLHLHAIRSLSCIYACKRKLDAAAPPHADLPPPRPPD